MNASWLAHPLLARLGWTLLHALWQDFALVTLAAVLLAGLRHRSAALRYGIAYLALLLALALPVLTFGYLAPPPASITAQSSPTNAPGLAPSVLPPLVLPALTPDTMGLHADTATTRRSLMNMTLPWLSVAWMLGVAVLASRMLLGFLQVQRLRRTGTRAPAAWQATLDRLARRLALSRPVVLLESALVQVPTALGELRPLILVPASALSGMPPAQLEALLAHELAHLRRHDYLANLLQCLIETLLFYHPAIWWLSARVRQEREHCCDDLAAAACGNRLLYAHALTTMASLVQPGPALALGARGAALLPRVRRILAMGELPAVERPRRWLPVSSGLVVLAVVGALVYIVGCKPDSPPPGPATQAATTATTAPAASSAADQRLQEQLAAEASFTAERQGLARVLEDLAQVQNVPIQVDWHALAAAGVTKDSPLSVRLRRVPLQTILNSVLAEVGRGQLRFATHDGVIVISTRGALDAAAPQIVRVYDIRDLLVQPQTSVVPPSLDISPTTQAAAAPPAALAEPSRDLLLKNIVDVIQDTIAPESWLDEGGVGSIRELNGQLIIAQTAEHHAAIAQLLDQLREARAVQIVVEARLLMLDEPAFRSLCEADEIKGAARGAKSESEMASSCLTDEQVRKIQQRMEAGGQSSELTVPRITLFNGQQGYVAVTTQQNYVASYAPTTRPVDGLEPELDVRTLNTGLVFFVQATASADRKYVVVKMKPQLSMLDGMETFTPPAATSQTAATTAPGRATIQLPKVTCASMDTVASVPDGRTLLVGGQKITGRVEPIAAGTAAPGPLSPTRYLVILAKPRILLRPSAPSP